MRSSNSIQVFEYESLKIGTTRGKAVFKKKHFDALVKLNELHNNKYFTVGHKKIIFKQYVGVLQVNDVCIEVLPKADRSSAGESAWQKALIEMLRVTKRLKINQVDHANVTKQSKHLLDLYFEWYLNEVQKLIHQGLIKKYYRKQGNLNTLKGKLVFAKQISQNIIHKERFYTEHQVYDRDHLVHQILQQALGIIEQFTRGGYLYGKCKSIQLDFPEVKAINATAATFDKLVLGRKEQPYRTALEIARLIILNFAPNVKNGSEKMIALLFDMNNLWEEYILIQLKKAYKDDEYRVLGQRKKTLWNGITIRPDIVIMNGEKTELIIDTKWKIMDHNKPSTHDLRQMYVYNEYWNSAKALLLYPSNASKEISIKAFEQIGDKANHQCGIATVSVLNNDDTLNKQLGEDFKKKLEDNKIFE
ncbi:MULTISPECIES: McrC family protein [Leeuwenhoekiella]|uniref:McrC family protein n=1 Tax=Leeuwenhoekiella TaxID=283735 RepID=UPI000C4CECCC|nr:MULTISPECIES: restriction endonuclease [Leeuwenhoekiella]MAO41929.1 restriction endonuclease [Leeuwenhoekiella sp.]|tara:strand:- start:631 stop:1884 length:1254 start_codon:yes stop_codon:yes gene_type:complete